MRPVYQKRLAALKRRRDFLANRISEGEENSHDLREHLALEWVIDVIERIDAKSSDLLEGAPKS